MEKYFYEDNKYMLLIIIGGMFFVFFGLFLISLLQDSFQVSGLYILILIIAAWYFLLFISIFKETYSSIEFDNHEKFITLYAKYHTKLKIPFEHVHLIKFSRGAFIRCIYFTKIEIFTSNKRYKITLLKDIRKNDELIQKLSAQMKTEYHNTIFLIP